MSKCVRWVFSPLFLLGLVAACGFGPWSDRSEGGDWPQWRGPNSDGSVSGFDVPKTWPKSLTKKWNVSVGDAISSPVLVDKRVYTFSRVGGNEVITCLDAAKGDKLWQEKYSAEEVRGMASNFGGKQGSRGPRSTPAVGEGKVCTLGVDGTVSCYDAEKGTVVWQKKTKSKPKFFTSASPVIAGGKCIVLLGKDRAELTAYDLAKGEEKWKWSGGGASYGSPVVATIGGVKQVVTPKGSGIAGVNLEDGKLLWQANVEVGRYSTGTPIIDKDVVIFMGTAYKVEKKGDKFEAKELWKDQKPATYNTPVLRDGLIYGLKSAGGGGKGRGGSTNLYCQDAKTGEVLWTDRTSRGECGVILDAGKVLVGLSSNSELFVFEPSKKEYKELAKYKEASDGQTWSVPLLDGNKVYVKGNNSLTLWVIE